MAEPLASLVAANVAFVGSHFALSHPLRAPLVGMLGEKGFLGLYSLVSLAAFAWIVHAFGKAPAAPLWPGGDDISWAVASLLTIEALALLIGSFKGNPALPGTGAGAVAAAQPGGVFAVTRHPMMWGFALWALAHILVWPSPRTLITAGAMGFLALVGAHLQDRKKRALLGDAWAGWEARTSFWPRFGAMAGVGWGVWALALALWLALTWAHVWLAGIGAGVWRWVG